MNLKKNKLIIAALSKILTMKKKHAYIQLNIKVIFRISNSYLLLVNLLAFGVTFPRLSFATPAYIFTF